MIIWPFFIFCLIYYNNSPCLIYDIFFFSVQLLNPYLLYIIVWWFLFFRPYQYNYCLFFWSFIINKWYIPLSKVSMYSQLSSSYVVLRFTVFRLLLSFKSFVSNSLTSLLISLNIYIHTKIMRRELLIILFIYFLFLFLTNLL